MSNLIFAIIALAFLFTGLHAEASVKRPPQFVMLAFDGSSSIDMWKETRQFVKDAEGKGAKLKFTYFVSGVYYVGKPYKSVYTAPGHGVGSSAIGWGADAKDLLARYEQTNLANNEGNEIASHANGHWDGGKWSYNQWRDEFEQFHHIIADFLDINHLTSLVSTTAFPSGWTFQPKEIHGFRAPLLGDNDDMRRVLKDFRYQYDTSKTSQSNYWPEVDKIGGHWNFPLAGLKIAGTAKRTLSMDYNFYFADSAGKPNPAGKALFKKQMLDTYLQYFQQNYLGNRAPIHIGHHFSKWNGGAYWEAMQEFALKVCSLPDVRCGTYTDLVRFINSQTPAQIDAYRRKDFGAEDAPRLVFASTARSYDLDIHIRRDGDSLTAVLTGADAKNVNPSVEIRANGVLVPTRTNNISLPAVRRLYNGLNIEISALVRDASGKEIATATQRLNNAGIQNEFLSQDRREDYALKGDLPEAHLDEAPEAP